MFNRAINTTDGLCCQTSWCFTDRSVQTWHWAKWKLTCLLLLNKRSAGHRRLLDRPRGGRGRLQMMHTINIAINIIKLQNSVNQTFNAMYITVYLKQPKYITSCAFRTCSDSLISFHCLCTNNLTLCDLKYQHLKTLDDIQYGKPKNRDTGCMDICTLTHSIQQTGREIQTYS